MRDNNTVSVRHLSAHWISGKDERRMSHRGEDRWRGEREEKQMTFSSNMHRCKDSHTLFCACILHNGAHIRSWGSCVPQSSLSEVISRPLEVYRMWRPIVIPILTKKNYTLNIKVKPLVGNSKSLSIRSTDLIHFFTARKMAYSLSRYFLLLNNYGATWKIKVCSVRYECVKCNCNPDVFAMLLLSVASLHCHSQFLSHSLMG